MSAHHIATGGLTGSGISIATDGYISVLGQLVSTTLSPEDLEAIGVGVWSYDSTPDFPEGSFGAMLKAVHELVVVRNCCPCRPRGGGGPDVTDERLPRRRSRYEEPEWDEWTEEDERDLKLALARARELQQEPAIELQLQLGQPGEPISLERQAEDIKPVVSAVQRERELTRTQAIELVTSGVEAQLVAAHKDQLISDDELLVLMLTVM